jgi:hypothetical protein
MFLFPVIALDYSLGIVFSMVWVLTHGIRWDLLLKSVTGYNILCLLLGKADREENSQKL